MKANNKIIFCTILMWGTASLATLSPEAQKELNQALTHPDYKVDYAKLCTNNEGKKVADEVHHALDEILTALKSSVYSTRTQFSNKRNSFETYTYGLLSLPYSHLENAEKQNSDSWSSECILSK